MGVPPIAWIVLALLWFGPDGPGAAFTVAVSILPLVFVAVLQGMNTRAAALDEMALLFRAPPLQRFTDLLFPQLLAQLLPAAASALGYAWKVCVMSEVMGSGTGIGGRLLPRAPTSICLKRWPGSFSSSRSCCFAISSLSLRSGAGSPQ